MTNSRKMRIIIADDERPARKFLRALLDEMSDVEVIAEAENGALPISSKNNLLIISFIKIKHQIN